MSKPIVKPSTSKAIVEPITSRVFKTLRYEFHDDNLLFDSLPPKRRRVTRTKIEEEEALKEKSRQAAEVSRKHKKRTQEPETLILGKQKRARESERPKSSRKES
jgi:hypothetical protein